MLVLTPVYNHFFIAIDNSGCSAAECERLTATTAIRSISTRWNAGPPTLP